MAKGGLPKRILGIKVPKRLRRSGLGRALASPLGQEIAAEALVAAVVGLAAAMRGEDSRLRRRLQQTGVDVERLARAVEALKRRLERRPLRS